MASVTQRIKAIQQPRGGYVPVKSLEVVAYDDGITLHEENIHASLIGLAVDYLTRFMTTLNGMESFKVSLLGASVIGKEQVAFALLRKVKGLDNESIRAVCQLVGFDVCFRAGVQGYKPVEDIIPDDNTISNIRVMVNRSILFLEKYGPVIKDGFTFEGGYTQTVDAGDGDFLTKDTLWDFKVSKTEPKKEHTLQLLMYYIMGKKSLHREFGTIKKIGIFNPRLNKVYTMKIDEIPESVIDEVSKNVIGYGLPKMETQTNSTGKTTTKSTENYMSASDVAIYLGISKSKVYSLIREGEIYAQKRGNKYLIALQDVEEYEEKVRMHKLVVAVISIVFSIVMLLMCLFWVS